MDLMDEDFNDWTEEKTKASPKGSGRKGKGKGKDTEMKGKAFIDLTHDLSPPQQKGGHKEKEKEKEKAKAKEAPKDKAKAMDMKEKQKEEKQKEKEKQKEEKQKQKQKQKEEKEREKEKKKEEERQAKEHKGKEGRQKGTNLSNMAGSTKIKNQTKSVLDENLSILHKTTNKQVKKAKLSKEAGDCPFCHFFPFFSPSFLVKIIFLK